MARPRRVKLYPDLTRERYSKIVHIGYELSELFNEEELEDIVSDARLAIAGEFYFATERNPRYKPGNGQRKERSTDNYIVGVGGRPSDLARHVAGRTRRRIISARSLPSDVVTDLAPTFVDIILQRVMYDATLLAINVMNDEREVWYDESTGIWSIMQSTVDGFVAERKFRRAVRQTLKHDDRSYHGRVRSQSKRRGIPEGVSIGYVS